MSVTEKPLATKVRVIAHRGASALRPEHTLAAYGRAIADGADFVEPDLVMTKDGVLLVRHENGLAGSTDVAAHAAFAARRVSKSIDGQVLSDWFSEDFTLAELKTLRAREPLPALRGTDFDSQFPLVTLAELIAFVAAESAACGRLIGLVPEIKHSSYFRGLGLPIEDALLATLAAHNYTRTAPVYIQSFEISNLKYLRARLVDGNHTNIRLVQLLEDGERQAADVVLAGGQLSYAQMMTPDGLRKIASYADVIGPERRAILPLRPDGMLAAPTALMRDAHAAGLELSPYTFRPENQFLPKSLWQGDDPLTYNAAGGIAEIRAFLEAGIDAFFTDDPALGRAAVAQE